MKKGWEYKTLEEACNVQYGTRVVRNKVLGTEYPVYGGGGETFRIDRYNRENCVVVARFAMSKQCTRFVKGKFFLNDSGLTVSPKESVGLTIELLEKYLIAYNDLIYSFGRGSAQRNLNMAEFRTMPISFPKDIAEQRRIVSYLDSSFDLIDKIKENASKSLSEAKALFQSALAEAMEPKEGWEEKTLGEICFIARGGSPRPIKNFITEDKSGIPWIKIGDTEIGGKYIYTTKEKIKREGIKSSRYVKKGDFLLSNSMSFGRPYILKTDGCIHDGWLVLQNFGKTFLEDFLYYLLLSQKVQKQFDALAYGSTVRNLKTDSVSKVIVSYPSLSTQKQIVSRLDSLSSKVRAIEEKCQKMIAECDALKQAMLREVFE